MTEESILLILIWIQNRKWIKKMDTNILSAIAPRLANTTKIIYTKAWDKLIMQQKLE
jgi:hypothetical protein